MSWQEYSKTIQAEYHIENDDTVIRIPFENILEIQDKELFFIDNAGKRQRISLEACARNFCEAFGLSIDDLSVRKIKGIGGRYGARPIGFYELFTDDHHIRFCKRTETTALKELLMKMGWNSYAKEDAEFRSFEKKLRAIGYSTIDLT